MNSGWKPGQGRRARNAGKGSGLDDLLGDLIGNDDDPPTKPLQTWPGKSSKGPAKKKLNDDDFYSSLAADWEAEESDVSDADPGEMAKTLSNLDDMDADLFGPAKKKPVPKKQEQGKAPAAPTTKQTAAASGSKSPVKSDIPNKSVGLDRDVNPTKTASPRVPKSTGASSKPTSKSKTFDFADLDDDELFAAVLSEEEDEKPKVAKGGQQKPKPTKAEEKPSEAVRPGTSRGRAPTDAKAPPKPAKDDLFSDDDDGLAGLDDSPPPQPKQQPKPMKGKTKKDDLNFDDDSDPLAGLDSPRREKRKPKKDDITFSDDDDPLAGLDEKPKTPQKGADSKSRGVKKDDIDFDDGDVLDTMGFDDSPRKAKNDEDAPKGRSILDSLLGKGSVNKEMEKTGPGQRREFVLDEKYKKKEPTQKDKKVIEPSEDDFNFGDYMPSAAATMKPGSRRSVRFQEDEDELFGLSTFPSARGSGGARRGRGGISATVDNEDGDDWLSMASGKSAEKSKPAAAAEVKPKQKKKSDDSLDWLGLGDSIKETKSAEEDTDWLGRKTQKKLDPKLSSAGDTQGLGQHTPDKLTESPEGPRSGVLKKQASQESSDWLGLGNETAETKPAASSDRDWLGIGDQDSSPDKSDPGDWLGFAKKQQVKKEEQGFSDWLGIKDSSQKTEEKKSASPRSSKTSAVNKQKSGEADDWLSLGEEVKSVTPQPAQRPPSADERGLDLFSPPAKRDASLPWETGKNKQKSEVQSGATEPKASRQPSGSAEAQPISTSTSLPPSRATEPSPLQSQVSTTMPSQQLAMTSQVEQLQKMQQEQERLHTENLRRQEEAMLEAQTLAMKQQQDHQAALQRQMKEQQEHLLKMRSEQMNQQMAEQQRRMEEEQRRMEEERAKMEQQLKQQQLIQQQQMEQQLKQQQQILQQPSLLNTSQMPPFGISSVFSPVHPQQANVEMVQQRALAESSLATLELETKIRKLEIERDHLQTMVETIRQRHEEELSAVEAANKSKLSIIEESFQRREARLKEENELLAAQNLSKVRQIEEEKAKMITEQFAKFALWDKDKTVEIERLKELHKNALESMRKDHEDSVERLRKTKDQEIAAASSGHEHSKSMQVVLEQMQMNTRDLGQLQHRIHNHHTAGLDDREITMRAKDEKLKVLEERLVKQQEENDRERIRLQELVAKMELQIRDQGRQLEEERWRVKQEQSRLDALQHSLEEEKRINGERTERERKELQKAREDLLTEQKSILSQLYEERRVLSSERADFNVSQRLLLNRENTGSIRSVKATAELEGTMNKLAEDKAAVGARLEELRVEKEKLGLERVGLEQDRIKLVNEREVLAELATKLKHRSGEIEEMSREAARVHEEGVQALSKAKSIESGHQSQLHEVEAKIEALRVKERMMAQERLAVAQDKRELQNVQNSLTCQSCRTPIKDITSALNYRNFTGLPTQPLRQVQNLTTGGPALDLVNDPHTRIKTWQISARKDKEFLADESLFLESLKYSPYASQNAATS